MIKSALLMAMILGTAIISSCGNDPSGVISTSQTSSIKGNLYGRVLLVGEDGRQMADNSGTTVAIMGTSYSATTAADGTWRMNDLPQGTYVIMASKTGFTTYTDSSFQFVGRGTVHYDTLSTYQENFPSLYKRPSYNVDSVSAQIVGQDITVNGSISPVPGGVIPRVTCLVSTSPSVSNSYCAIAEQVPNPGPGGGFTCRIGKDELRFRGIASGTTIYLAAYPGSITMVARFDRFYQQYYPLNFTSPSNVVSVVIP